MIWVVILTALWLWVGASNFIYWWNKSEKFNGTDEEMTLLFVASIFGPITFLVGWMVHRNTNN